MNGMEKVCRKIELLDSAFIDNHGFTQIQLQIFQKIDAFAKIN